MSYSKFNVNDIEQCKSHICYIIKDTLRNKSMLNMDYILFLHPSLLDRIAWTTCKLINRENISYCSYAYNILKELVYKNVSIINTISKYTNILIVFVHKIYNHKIDWLCRSALSHSVASKILLSISDAKYILKLSESFRPDAKASMIYPIIRADNIELFRCWLQFQNNSPDNLLAYAYKMRSCEVIKYLVKSGARLMVGSSIIYRGFETYCVFLYSNMITKYDVLKPLNIFIQIEDCDPFPVIKYIIENRLSTNVEYILQFMHLLLPHKIKFTYFFTVLEYFNQNNIDGNLCDNVDYKAMLHQISDAFKQANPPINEIYNMIEYMSKFDVSWLEKGLAVSKYEKDEYDSIIEYIKSKNIQVSLENMMEQSIDKINLCLVESLINNGVDIYTTNKYFVLATNIEFWQSSNISTGKLKMIKLLFEYGANIDIDMDVDVLPNSVPVLKLICVEQQRRFKLHQTQSMIKRASA